jgi:hypothetical protein
MVVRGTDDSSLLTCRGVTMTEEPVSTVTHTDTDEAPTILVGKRYVDEATGVELLCVKAGAGPLEFAGNRLTLKSAKPLPSSD